MIVSPGPPVAVAVYVCVVVPSVQTVWLVAAGAAGAGFIVKITAVLVKLEQVPLEDSAKIVLVPTPICVGEVTTVPPVVAVYQVIVPPVAVAVNVCVVVPSVQTVWLVAVGAAGAAFIVRQTGVLVKLEQVPLEDSAK